MRKRFGYWGLVIGVCFGFWILSFGFLTLVSGCGQQVTTPEPSAVTPAGKISIKGSLYSGSIGAATIQSAGGIKILATATTPIQSYEVVAVGKEDGKVYFPESKTDADGNFTIPKLPSGEAFYLEVLDSNNKLVAPISMGTTGAGSGKTIMAVTPEGQAILNMGKIAFSSSEGTAVPTTEPTTCLDESALANVKSGKNLIPVGAGNFGKGTDPKLSDPNTYNPNKIDGDSDGLPNFFDADNNGDGTVDEFDGLSTLEASLLGNFYPYVFTNLKVDYDVRNTFKTDYLQFDLAVGVVETKGLSAKSIQSVRVSEGPSWLTKATTQDGTALWSSSNYNVPFSPARGCYEVHLGSGSVKPGIDVTAGDALKFHVTYTDGTSEEAIKMINFVFTDIPSVTAYKIGSGDWVTSLLASGPLTTASTTEISLRWMRPKDETNQEIIGGYYTFEYPSTSTNITETIVIPTDNGSTTSLEATVNFATISSANLSADPFMVGVCIRSAANDNSAENVWFTKGW